MEIILKSLASAVVTAIILVIAKFSGPKLAGAIGGIPIVFAISYILLTMGDKGMSKPFLIGGIYGAIAAVLFSLILLWLNSQFLKTHWLNFAIAYIACFFFALAMVHFTTK
ncbi:hypothetical protein HN748_00635 [Candidatus Peregrinibacteria bacterium]|jgi:hypothetical protein|nr:hypothetical protein [Candidatus Peregrinibacteria bacterium]MBT7483657.1 hypothetical protein [Candidatus Peregrinibacteria bacterium]MBT7702716.1 hypothetical protein [Candidatus Peregrinibacteria bacterium]